MKATPIKDPVLAVYMRDVDRTLLRENLKLTPTQRLEKLSKFASFALTLRQAGKRARANRSSRG